MVAISISPEQIRFCKKEGIESYIWDMLKYNPNFVNKFDHIVFMGSSEHLYSGSVTKYDSYIEKNNKLVNLFTMLKKYLRNENSKIFYSELHVNPNFINSMGMYIVERTCGGTMSLNTDSLNAAAAAKKAGYTLQLGPKYIATSIF
jgi:hypothetical protein